MQHQSHDYFINQELIEEMVRLKRQATLVTREMGGVLPEQQQATTFHTVLDLACGPGEWMMQMASNYPHLQQIIGVDISRRMVEYANIQAEAAEVSNVAFRVMDILQPLDFPDASFDLINGRFLLGFMKREQWPMLLAECYRLLRPGGILRITEQESGFSNDPSYQQYMDIWGAAWRKAGHAFAQTNAFIGVTVELKRLMHEAGLREPHHRPISIDLSTDQPAHREMLENLALALHLASPFLLALHVSTKRKIEILVKDMESLIGKQDFAAYWFLQTIWAEKPE